MNPFKDDPRPAPPLRYRMIMVFEGPVTSLMGMSCRDFAKLHAASLDRKLGFGERARLRLHARLCPLCRNFAAQFDVINELARELDAEATEVPAASQGHVAGVERVNEAVRRQLRSGQ